MRCNRGWTATGQALVVSVALDAVEKVLAARTRLSPLVLERAIDQGEVYLRASVHWLQDFVLHTRDAAGFVTIEIAALATGFRVLK